VYGARHLVTAAFVQALDPLRNCIPLVEMIFLANGTCRQEYSKMRFSCLYIVCVDFRSITASYPFTQPPIFECKYIVPQLL
jgi:hypothetical protein